MSTPMALFWVLLGLVVLSLPSSVISVRSAIAVVGRPNVGKSTIVNRLTQKFGTSGAVVYDEPGVTRDRTYGKGFWGAHEFSVIDTGGLVFDDDPNQVFMPHIRQQALAALTEAQVALLVVDGKDGCSPLDEDIASRVSHSIVGSILDRSLLETILAEYEVDTIYHLAALLSRLVTARLLNLRPLEHARRLLLLATHQGGQAASGVAPVRPRALAQAVT